MCNTPSNGTSYLRALDAATDYLRVHVSGDEGMTYDCSYALCHYEPTFTTMTVGRYLALGGLISMGGVELCDGRSDDAQSETLLARADPPRAEPWAQASKEQTERDDG